jgi:hypothetical protein
MTHILTQEIKMSIEKDKFINKFVSWVDARRKVEDEIARARARIHALKASAKIIDHKISSGEAWPGAELESATHI